METAISLIVTIVNKGWGEKVLQASIKAGAKGGTIMLGRGIGIHEKCTILGLCIEPEKEIVFSLLYSDNKEEILQEIIKAGELEKPGAGIAFVLPVDKVAGVVHLAGDACQESTGT